jgi:hypothetical protein
MKGDEPSLAARPAAGQRMPMRQSKTAFGLLVVGIVIGCAAEHFVVVPPARAGTSPPKWEYSCFIGDRDLEENVKRLNSFGQEGWELVSEYGDQRGQWCLKRPLP